MQLSNSHKPKQHDAQIATAMKDASWPRQLSKGDAVLALPLCVSKSVRSTTGHSSEHTRRYRMRNCHDSGPGWLFSQHLQHRRRHHEHAYGETKIQQIIVVMVSNSNGTNSSNLGIILSKATINALTTIIILIVIIVVWKLQS